LERSPLILPKGEEHILIDAVDNSERPMQRLFRVQEKDYKEALADEHYTIVICAWMPFGADWTSDIRKKASVLEYILIGHTGDGLNGDPLRTWGYRKHHYDPDDDGGDDDDEGVHKEGYLPPEEREHVKDGFDRVDLPHLSKWQLCRFDNVDACSGQMGSSRTTSFRRAPPLLL